MRDDLLVFNGINATTGGYLLPPMSPERISKIALGQVFEPDHIAELRWRHHQSSDVFFGPKAGVDPKKLAEAGWGVIFAHDADPVISLDVSPALCGVGGGSQGKPSRPGTMRADEVRRSKRKGSPCG